MLNQDFEEDGFWWFPDNPDKKYAGEFKYEVEDSMILSIIELGTSLNIQESGNVISAIYGITTSGKLITLIDCFDNGSSWSSSGITKRKLSPRIAYIGSHIPIDDQLFRASYFNLNLAAKWLRNSGINIKNKESYREVEIDYREPDAIKVLIGDEFDLVIKRHLSNIPFKWFDMEDLKLEERVSFQIRPFKPMTLDYFIDKIYLLRDLLTIVCDRVCSINDISLECNFIDERSPGKKIHATTELLMDQHKYHSNLKKIDSRDFILVYSDVKDIFPIMLNKWFQIADKIRIVKDLYIAALYSPSKYIETEFLSLVQAIEVYHRRFLGGEYLSTEDFELKLKGPLTAAIDPTLPKNFKDAVKKRLEYFNEFSLSKRLKEIVKKFEPLIIQFFSNPVLIVRHIVEARNFLTHYSKSYKDDDFFNEVLIDRDFLKLLLDICFLNELGLDIDKISKLITKNNRYNRRIRFIAR